MALTTDEFLERFDHSFETDEIAPLPVSPAPQWFKDAIIEARHIDLGPSTLPPGPLDLGPLNVGAHYRPDTSHKCINSELVSIERNGRLELTCADCGNSARSQI